MKNTIKLFTAVALSCVSAQATVILNTANFQGGGSGIAVVDNAGVPIPIAVSIGTFGTGYDFGAADLGDFTRNGSDLSAFQPGLFNGALSEAVVDATNQSSFVGAPIHIVAAGDFGVGSDFVVFELTQNWVLEDPNVPATSNYGNNFLSGANVVRGELVERTGELFSSQFTFTSAVTATAIPEPSSALLAGLALVGGLVRRRR